MFVEILPEIAAAAFEAYKACCKSCSQWVQGPLVSRVQLLYLRFLCKFNVKCAKLTSCISRVLLLTFLSTRKPCHWSACLHSQRRDMATDSYTSRQTARPHTCKQIHNFVFSHTRSHTLWQQVCVKGEMKCSSVLTPWHGSVTGFLKQHTRGKWRGKCLKWGLVSFFPQHIHWRFICFLYHLIMYRVYFDC